MVKKLVLDPLDPHGNTAQNGVDIVVSSQEKRILCLTKIEDLGKIIQLSLEILCGWQVVTAQPSTEVVAIARQLKPNLILLDTQIDDENQLSILNTLTTSPVTQSIPILVLVETMRDRKYTYINSDVVAAIAKPFDMIDFAIKIAQHLNWDHSQL
jgi:CheY-like chemotaxis protein